MKFEDISRLAPAFACVVALAAAGCGATGDGVESQVGSSNLQGAGHVQGARGDGGWDRDKDVDEAADEAVSPGQGAAGSAPVDKPGRRGDDVADADGGVDEDCERPGFGGGFGSGNGGGGHDKGGFGGGFGSGGPGTGGPGKGGSQPPQDGGQAADDDDDDDDNDSQGSRGRR